MKGPGFRYDLDIRRVWECPECGQRLRYLGHVTSRRCNCDADGHWMQIVDENFRRTFPEREKIVIPEEYPAEPEPVTEEPAAEESPEQVNVESSVATEITTPPQDAEANPPAETESPVPKTESPAPPRESTQSAPPETNPETAPNRKKRRKKRRRKKSRNKPPESSGNQESQQNSPAPPPPSGENPKPGSPGEDFGTNVF